MLFLQQTGRPPAGGAAAELSRGRTNTIVEIDSMKQFSYNSILKSKDLLSY